MSGMGRATLRTQTRLPVVGRRGRRGAGIFRLGHYVGAGLNARDHAGRQVAPDLVIGDYPGYTQTPPTAYWDAGKVRANRVFPRDSAGVINWNTGAVGLADFSGSVGHLIYATAQALGGLSRYIRYARTSRPGYPLRAMVDASLPEYSSYWDTWVPTRLTENNLTAAQVGIAVLANGMAFGPSYAVGENEWYTDYQRYVADSAAMQQQLISEITTRFPNVRLILAENMPPMHFSLRLSVFEPYIFLRYFSLQRIIHDFINSGAYASAVYWLGWGADYYAFPGLARSDGLTWTSADVQPDDGVHPTTTKTSQLVTSVLNPHLRRAGSPQEIVCGDQVRWPTTALATLTSTTAATSYAVGPFNVPAGKLVLVGVHSTVSSGTPNVPTVSGTTATITQVTSWAQGTARLTVFRLASATGESNVTLTVAFGGQTQSRCDVVVGAVDYATWDAADQGVVRSAVNSAASTTSLTVTFPSAGDPRNGVVVFWRNMVTPDSESSAGSFSSVLTTSWRGNWPEVNAVTGSRGAAASMIGIACEVRRA